MRKNSLNYIARLIPSQKKFRNLDAKCQFRLTTSYVMLAIIL